MLVEFVNQKALETWELQRHKVWNEYGMVINTSKSKVMTKASTNQLIAIRGAEFRTTKAFTNFLREISFEGTTTHLTLHNRNNINTIDADLIGTSQEANRLKDICKGHIKTTTIVTAGATTYEVVDTFKYLGILTGPKVAKKWDETLESI